ncbi:MAG: hypothetical protein ACK5FU_05725 [Bacteroidota bacterium]|jgi:hypothetical protein|nr:hypothetical protein [Sphingobacteriales bacterium]
MDKNARNTQLDFLMRVKDSAPQNISFVDELAEVLGMSNDSAYRRLRGETLLGIDEIAAICKHFKVPFETEVQKDVSSVSFNFLQLEDKPENFAKWLESLNRDVKHISSVQGSHILYAADDVPIWHHFIHNEFIAFKLFYWMKSILNIPAYASSKFSLGLVDSSLIKNAQELLQHYNKTQSTEIWTEDTMNSTLKQVEYFWESGFFEDKATALRMCEYIMEVIETLEEKVKHGSKLQSKEENFQLYMSEVMVGNNSILVSMGKTKVAYVSNNTFNFMSTTNPGLIEENEKWLKNLIKKSVLISGVSEKQRNRFFNILKDKVELLKRKIK